MKRFFSALLAVIMILAASAAAIPASAARSGFSDVEEDRWSVDSIKYAVDNGYMKGVADEKFAPDGPLTRAMAATVLWRVAGTPDPSSPCGFIDVPSDEWYSDAVAWAEEAGVTFGVSEAYFDPEGNVTREALSALLFRFSSLAPVSVTERADLTEYSDGEDVADWAVEPFGWAIEAGLVEGVDGGALAPSESATREQFAAIIERYDDVFKLQYNSPVIRTSYKEREYPLVTDADFYVSTTGDDAADGSFEHPFGTWSRALEAVRSIDRTGKDEIKVAFMGGDYGQLGITLTPEDGGDDECRVVFCKYGDGDVVFNNGLDLRPDDFTELTEDEKAHFPKKAVENIRKADVSYVLENGIDAGDVIIFHDGGICVEARYPNKYADGSDYLMPAASYNDAHSLKIFNPVMMRKLAGYDELSFSTMKTYGYIIRGYRKDTFIVGGYDPETGVLDIANWETSEFGVMRNWSGVDGKGLQLCITNVPAELDAPHEYWIDPSTATLYAYDPDGTYHVPVRGTMIEMSGVNDVTFRGLSFRNTSGSFIRGELSHGVSLERCSFSGCSSIAGVYFNDCLVDRPLGLAVRECDFSLAYGASLYANGGCSDQYRFAKRSDIVFDNNFVSSSNLCYDVECAIDLPRCCGLTVTHNEFRNTSRGAVSSSAGRTTCSSNTTYSPVSCRIPRTAARCTPTVPRTDGTSRYGRTSLTICPPRERVRSAITSTTTRAESRYARTCSTTRRRP